MSDDEWDTDPDFVNNQSEEQQRWGGARGAGGGLNMQQLAQEVKEVEAEKSKAKSGFQRGYGGAHGHEDSGDQTTASKPGKKVWQPKNTFDQKMEERQAKESSDPQPAAPKPAAPQPPAPQPPKPSHPLEEAPPAKPPPPKPAAPAPPKPASPAPPKPSDPAPPKPAATAPPKPSDPPPPKPSSPAPPKPAAPPKPSDPAPPKPSAPKDEPPMLEHKSSEDLRAKGFDAINKEDQQIKRKEGEAFGAYHSYGEEKVQAFSEYINYVLAEDQFLKGSLPIDPVSDDLFKVVAEGILLCRLVDKAQPGVIFEKAINTKIKSIHHQVENHNLAINSAKSIGCNVVNIGAQDLIEKRPHLVLGLVWQIIKIMLFKKVSLREHPELVVLLEGGEELADLLKLSPEEILMRWVNHHLKNAGCSRKLSNFSGDIKDSEIYTHLMSQICPGVCDKSALSESDPKKRAGRVLQNADKIGCRKFVNADNIVSGNAQLNMAFTALLFNEYPALEMPEDNRQSVEMAALLEEEDEGDSREERVFKNWMNALGIDKDVNNLIEDCKSGEVLLELVDKLKPALVNWKMVTKGTKIQIKTIQNCNYMVDCAKELGLSVVNVGGKDIVDGNKKLVLGLVWQMMRKDTVSLLEKLSDGGKISDSDLIKWANDRVKGKAQIASFQDQELGTGRFLLHLCDAVTPGVVNWELVMAGESAEEKEQNAKYVLSVARKMGCGVFLLWEDVVEVKPKMLMTFVGSVMSLDKSR